MIFRSKMLFLLVFNCVLLCNAQYRYSDWIEKSQPNIAERTIWRINQRKEVRKEPTASYSVDTVRNKQGAIVRIDTSLIDPPDRTHWEPDSVLIEHAIYDSKGLVTNLDYDAVHVDYWVKRYSVCEYDSKQRLIRITTSGSDSVHENEEWIYNDSLMLVVHKRTGYKEVTKDKHEYDKKGRISTRRYFDEGNEIHLAYKYDKDNKTVTSEKTENGVNIGKYIILLSKWHEIYRTSYDSEGKIGATYKYVYQGGNLMYYVFKDETGILTEKKYAYSRSGLPIGWEEYDEKGLKYKYVILYKRRAVKPE